MLNLQFGFDEDGYVDVKAEPPYTELHRFFRTDVGGEIRWVDERIERLRAVIERRMDPFDGYGNGWFEEIDAKTARLSDANVPHIRMEMPTEWLLGALIRWREYLVARKAARERAKPPAS
jgi:hypothetical protein